MLYEVLIIINRKELTSQFYREKNKFRVISYLQPVIVERRNNGVISGPMSVTMALVAGSCFSFDVH